MCPRIPSFLVAKNLPFSHFFSYLALCIWREFHHNFALEVQVIWWLVLFVGSFFQNQLRIYTYCMSCAHYSKNLIMDFYYSPGEGEPLSYMNRG